MITLNDQAVEITRFPDNSIKFDIKADTVKDMNEIKWNFESMEELFIIAGVADKLNCANNTLLLPYLPNARMDKTANPFEGFMLKYFIEAIDSMGFSKVVILDPHSGVYKSFVSKTLWVEDDKVSDLITSVIDKVQVIEGSEKVILAYPDKGAMERYSAIINKEAEVYGKKERNQETGAILSFDLVESVQDKTRPVLIIDDICSKGGTFYHTSKKLREKGFTGNVYLYVTHCEKTVFYGELLKKDSEIHHIYTKNSIFKGTSKKITTIKL